MFGGGGDPKGAGEERMAERELCRLAIPRRHAAFNPTALMNRPYALHAWLDPGAETARVACMLLVHASQLQQAGAHAAQDGKLCRMATEWYRKPSLAACRVYTQAHIDFLLEVARIVANRRKDLKGFRILHQPQFLRHFSAVLAPIE